ncbi:MAG TPA: hypothetical protein PLL32_03325 [Anaeromyxobacteraceae bacterium]|nr:hypothetical protein [Anaeromyxobacteraceae bacterium]
MSGRALPGALALCLAGLLAPAPALAHHGSAVVGMAGPEGPGAALETTSPIPLPRGALFLMVKSEWVPYRQFDWADPENKTYSLFDTLVAGYGFAPWLSAYVFLPYNVKAQDGAGTNVGFGDPGVLVSLAFKYDEGFRLVPAKESLDELQDWHFSVFGLLTVPMGPTIAATPALEWYAPDMQTGFGSPSFQLGLSAAKQLDDDLTWLADASFQYFLPHTYPFTRYQFGFETRVNTALAWRVVATPGFRLDLAGEVNFLNLVPDREADGGGSLQPLPASGGTILYGGLGVRAYAGRFSAALAARTSFARWLNDQAAQQGSEGLEVARVALTLSWVLPQ